MKIGQVELRDFLTFGNPGTTVTGLPDTTVIVGPNGAGKTNFLRGIEFVGDVFTRQLRSPREFVHRYDANRLISISIQVVLHPEEVDVLADLLVASAKSELRFSGRNDMDILLAQNVGGELLNRLRPAFVELLSHPMRFCVRGRASVSEPLEYFVEILGIPIPLFFTFNGLATTNSRVMGWQPINLGEDAVFELDSKHPGIFALGTSRKPLLESEIDEILSALGSDWLWKKFEPKGALPSVLGSMGISLANYENQPGASALDITRLRAFLSSIGYPLGGIGLRELAGLIFQTSIVRLSDARSAPEKARLPPIDSIAVASSPVDGSKVPNILFRLKNSGDPSERSRFRLLADAYREFTDYSVDVIVESIPVEQAEEPVRLGIQGGNLVAMPATSPEPMQSASLRWANQWVEFRSEFGAAGLFELLLPFLLVFGRSNSVVLLDEPALNLHRTKQRDLLELLRRVAQKLGNQLIIVSHSPAFVVPAEGQSLLRFSAATGETKVFRLSQPEEAERKRVIRDLQRTPLLVNALFATKVVLVEGGAEAAALPEWFRVLAEDTDLSRYGVEFIDAGGQTSFDGFVRVLNAWGVPYRIVADGKAVESLRGFGTQALTYPYDDFSILLETECSEALQKALSEIHSRNGSKAPAVAREVALSCEPPPSVVKLWESLREFIEVPQPSTGTTQ